MLDDAENLIEDRPVNNARKCAGHYFNRLI
jgi:hypothetical protein